MFKNLNEIKDYTEKNGIKMADFMTIDLNGRWRHLTMPIERLTESTLKNGIGFDGSNYGYAAVEKSDMVFIPDLSTAFIDPFAEVPTISMIGNVNIIDLPANRLFDQYPRTIAVRAEEYLRSSCIADELRIGPEYEFHVFDHVDYHVKGHSSKFNVDSVQAEWNSGKESENLGYQVPHKGGYHTAPPHDKLAGFRSRASIMMEKLGIEVKYHHHEVGGPGQLEIEVEFGGVREMADKTMFAKYILKNLAAAEGKTVTFLPKPIYGEAGNGLHVHMHLFKDGKPLFYDQNGYSQLSETAMFFMGGILKHIRALCGFTNPSTNSYKRLVPGYEAPVVIGFATANRSSVIRIPAYAKDPESKRFEIRSPDGTCNPYYAFAAILMAGIDGVKNKIDPKKAGYGPYDVNLYNLSKKEQAKIKFLPQNLDEALDALNADHAFLTETGVFPKQLIELWIENKKKDSARYKQLPHPVEYEMYFDL